MSIFYTKKAITIIICLLYLVILCNKANAYCANTGIAPAYLNHSACGYGQRARNVKLCDNNCNCNWITQCYNSSPPTPSQIINKGYF